MSPKRKHASSETSERKRSKEENPANDDNETTVAAKCKTPYQLYFEKLSNFIESRTELIGQVITRGIPRDPEEDEDYDDDKDEDAKEDTSKYTTEQMESLRMILVTQKRADMLDEMTEFVLGDQAHECMKFFNTSYSYEVLDSFSQLKNMRSRTKKWSEKFDLLFGYTFILKEYDTWMWDNEGGMDSMVKGLASLWKSTLKKSDEDLGIDGEYTRPGVVALLESFKTQIESAHSEPPFRFNFA